MGYLGNGGMNDAGGFGGFFCSLVVSVFDGQLLLNPPVATLEIHLELDMYLAGARPVQPKVPRPITR